MLEREGLCGIMLSGGSLGKRRVVGQRVRLGGRMELVYGKLLGWIGLLLGRGWLMWWGMGGE